VNAMTLNEYMDKLEATLSPEEWTEWLQNHEGYAHASQEELEQEVTVPEAMKERFGKKE
jgi:hypothetical protein